MSKLIITTVGTSTLDKIKKSYIHINWSIEELAEGKPLLPKIRPKVIEETVKKIIENIENNRSLNFLPAEIASLMVFKNNEDLGLCENVTSGHVTSGDIEFKNNEDLGLCENDMIALFATDTEDGKFCAEVIKKVLDELKWCNVLMPKVITGLKTQMTKKEENISQMFIEAGKNKLKEEVEKLLKNPEYTNNYFNITGGFKGVIPFVTIVASECKMSLVYLYGESYNLIVFKLNDTCSTDGVEIYSYEPGG